MKTTKKSILFLDMDNTIFPTLHYGPELFGKVYELVEKEESLAANMTAIKKDITRKPFQIVSKKYKFPKTLEQAGINLLQDLEFDADIRPFDDFDFIKSLQCRKFLVTTGFRKFQQCKINQLGIAHLFEECYIVDPAVSNDTKKTAFESLLLKYNVLKEAALVVGDDMHSEIQAAKDAGIDWVLYQNKQLAQYADPLPSDIPIIHNFQQLEPYFQ